MNGRLTITQVANAVGVTARTIMRWEKAGKIKRPKRDWRGWRFYYKEDVAEIKQFLETSYEYDEANGAVINSAKGMLAILMTALLAGVSWLGLASAETNFSQNKNKGIIETVTAVEIDLDKLPVVPGASSMVGDPVKYTLGPNDVIAIEVRRHPEFSGQYAINSEGKIEYKFVGDIVIEGLTKLQVKQRLTELLSEYIIEPEIDVTIVAYLSKVFYVVGDVGNPGKFYMRGNTVTVREALVQAGFPTGAASLKRCRLITPDSKGKNNFIKVNAYKLLYEGDLKCNLEMRPGDVLYVPATVMAKIIRIISPVTNVAGQAAGTASTAYGVGF